jgi:hypothetical protein
MRHTITVYTDYKSPYAYLAKDLTYDLARDFPISIDGRPYILDIPTYVGSARVDGAGRVIEAARNAHQWYACATAIWIAVVKHANAAQRSGELKRFVIQPWPARACCMRCALARRFSKPFMTRFLNASGSAPWI